MPTIILTGGGTAGHCTPNLALIPYLTEKFDKIYYIGSKNGLEKNLVKKEGIEYFSIPCAKLKRNFSLSNLTIPFHFINGIKDSKKILKKLKPDVIFSKGGYVSLPVVIAGCKLKIPVISHESDISLGLANKIASKFSNKLLTTFPETVKEVKNGVYVGTPLRKNIFNTNKKTALKKYKFNGEKPIIFITGGSQGSYAINKAVIESLTELLPKFDILHQCGKNNLSKEKLPKGYVQVEFIDNIEDAYAISDVCIARAGANTVFELLALKKPTLLIPLPKGASRGDQVLNAEYFQKRGLVSVLPQNVLTAKSLTQNVNALYSNRFNVKRSFEKTENFNGCQKISQILFDYIKK